MHTWPLGTCMSDKIGKALMFMICEEINEGLKIYIKKRKSRQEEVLDSKQWWRQYLLENTFFCYNGKKGEHYAPGGENQEEFHGDGLQNYTQVNVMIQCWERKISNVIGLVRKGLQFIFETQLILFHIHEGLWKQLANGD